MSTSITRAAIRVAPGIALALAVAGWAAGCAHSRPGSLSQEIVGQPAPAPAPPVASRVQRFPAENLYGHIDGGAELFLEFGFEELVVETYQADTLQVDLETYRMESPEAALAIYLAKCGREQPRSDLPGRNTVNPYQITVLHGRDFVQANNFSGVPEGLEFAAGLLRERWAQPAPSAEALLGELLPREGLVPGSESLVRGQFSLQPIVTLGEGDVLRLGGTIWGAVGSYARPGGGSETRVYVRYADAAAARSVMEHVAADLDPYLTITDRREGGFDYTDWRGWPGRLVLDGPLLVVHVPAEPVAAAE